MKRSYAVILRSLVKFAFVALAVTCFLLLAGAVEADPTGPVTLGLLFTFSLCVAGFLFTHSRRTHR